MNPLFLIPILLAITLQSAASEPVFPAPSSPKDVPELLKSTAFVRGLPEASLVAMVPEQSGLHFVGCPNCVEEKLEGQQLDWLPEHPDVVRCRDCTHRFPSEKYPMDRAVTVRNPRGKIQKYPYWQNAKGYRYFFGASRDDQVREYLAEKTQQLAMLYAATGDKAHGRRAALLLDRFAQVFPGWCYHYDYPFKQKVIYEGDVATSQFRPGYRTARWTWWAYKDIPDSLVKAYDWIRPGDVLPALSRETGVDVAARIERDLFRNAAEQVLANPENYHNMSPGAWRMLVVLGRVIGEPRYVHEVVRRARHFMELRFFYDGTWHEGSPDYNSQAVEWLGGMLRVLHGYSDPPGYRDPDGTRFDHLDLEAELPSLRRARAVLAKMRLPDGRSVPVHDTWPTSRHRASESSEPYLLPGLGHACLGGGTGALQTQFHLTWSGAYGHEHADNLSLLLFAYGREMLSDLGYTHTKNRGWTMATVAHNTVVIDGHNQASMGRQTPPTDGGLRLFDVRDGRVQVVSADGERGYPGLATVYRRTLITVDFGEANRYTVDVFQVQGGDLHDYFLHGDADRPTAVESSLKLEALSTLLPPGFGFEPLRNEGDRNRTRQPHYAYGFLRNLKQASPSPGSALPITFHGAITPTPSLRITLFPEPESRMILGENPAVRGAKGDDSRMDAFTRPFAMLRHEAKGTTSTFVAVIEPYATAPFLTGIERVKSAAATVALRVRRKDNRTDLIVYHAERPVTVNLGARVATFQGEVGVLSMRGAEVDHAYALGKGGWTCGTFLLRSEDRESFDLTAAEGDTFVLNGSGETLPPAGDVVRLVTADGWVYPFTVVDASQRDRLIRLRIAEGPGMTFDRVTRKLRLTAFPQREHSGAVRVDWMTHSARSL